MDRSKIGVVIALLGVAGMLAAVALQGPIVGVGASPLAPVLLLGGGAVMSVGLLLLMWFWRKR